MGATRRSDRKNKWCVSFSYRGIRIRRCSPVQTKEGAERFERVLRSYFLREEEAGRDPFAPPSPRLLEFVPRWIRNHLEISCRPSTVLRFQQGFHAHILPAFGHLYLDEITTEKIDVFKAALAHKGLSPKTINNTLSILHSCLVKASEWGQLRAVPKVRWLKVPMKDYRFLSSSDVLKLIQTAPEGYWRTLVLFIAKTGCRFGEAAGLQWDDLILDGPECSVRLRRSAVDGRVGPTKTNRIRQIPLSDDLVNMLRAFRHKGLYVFERSDGSPPTSTGTLRYLGRICKKAEIERISWHVLRHSFATELTAQGVPIRIVQELLGHTTIEMTARYSHVAPSSLRSAIEKLPSCSEAPHVDKTAPVMSPSEPLGYCIDLNY